MLSLLRSCGAGLVTVALHGGRHWCSPVAGGTLFQVGVQSCRGVGVVRVVPVSGPPFPMVFGVCVVVPPVPASTAGGVSSGSTGKVLVCAGLWFFSIFLVRCCCAGERSVGQSVILVSVGYSVVFKSTIGVVCITPLC